MRQRTWWRGGPHRQRSSESDRGMNESPASTPSTPCRPRRMCRQRSTAWSPTAARRHGGISLQEGGLLVHPPRTGVAARGGGREATGRVVRGVGTGDWRGAQAQPSPSRHAGGGPRVVPWRQRGRGYTAAERKLPKFAYRYQTPLRCGRALRQRGCLFPGSAEKCSDRMSRSRTNFGEYFRLLFRPIPKTGKPEKQDRNGRSGC